LGQRRKKKAGGGVAGCHFFLLFSVTAYLVSGIYRCYVLISNL
jgi:hypothetical protein